ncbi:Hsp70 family protein [Spirochaeta dissipatitropha]
MKYVIGIDLGTTNSAMAVWNGSSADIIPNDRGNRITPSVVAMTDSGEILVGESAVNQAAVNPSQTVFAVKRKMGTSHRFVLNGMEFSPTEISSWIISKLKQDAESFLGTELHEAVITVPAYFSEQQRRDTVNAGVQSGLRVLRVLNEPTAAALAYASREENKRTILVYDLGGGTFDASCLLQDGDRFTVLATAGDTELGGIDFTDRLFSMVYDDFRKQADTDLADTIIRQQLYEMVERCKIELSSREEVDAAIPFIGAAGKPLHLQKKIRRIELNAMISDLVERSLQITRQVLSDAAVEPSRIDSLVLSGGSSRIPLIRHLLSESLGCSQVSQVNPDEVVALGAAIQASMISEDRQLSLRDVTAFDLGVEIDKGRFAAIVKRNSTLPVNARQMFTTISDHQTAVEIHVLQGNHQKAAENSSLGRFLLSGIRQDKQGQPRIQIDFSVDVDGFVSVKAADKDTSVSQGVVLSSSTAEPYEADTGLRSRVQSLVLRLEDGCRQHGTGLDDDYMREARELCSLARRAVLQQDSEGLLQVKAALETMCIELQAMGGITREQN